MVRAICGPLVCNNKAKVDYFVKVFVINGLYGREAMSVSLWNRLIPILFPVLFPVLLPILLAVSLPNRSCLNDARRIVEHLNENLHNDK